MSEERTFTHDDLMPFGKHKGKKLRDVPASYLLWWQDQEPEKFLGLLAYIVEHEEELIKSKKDE